MRTRGSAAGQPPVNRGAACPGRLQIGAPGHSPLAPPPRFANNPPMTKAELRTLMLGRLKGLDPAAVGDASIRISRRLAGTEAWQRSPFILAFLSLRHEVDTRPILEAARAAGKTAAVPAINNDELSFRLLDGGEQDLPTGVLGLRMPDPSWPEIDPGREGGILVVLPGLAFDRRKNRLGRGKGYYDRFLQRARRQWPGRVQAVAVCFSLQIVGEVPVSPHDISADAVVTEEEVIG